MPTRPLALTALLALISVAIASAEAPGPLLLRAFVDGDTVKLVWLAPPTEGSYVVEASLSPSGPPIATLRVPTTALTVTAVPNGVYYVRVRGVIDGASVTSNEVIVVVPGGCATVPSPPQNLVGFATGNRVFLAWEPPPEGCPATTYTVIAGSAPGASNRAVVNVGTATSLSAIATQGDYHIRVVSRNVFGSGSPSNEIRVFVAIRCFPMLARPTLTAQVSGGRVVISWTRLDQATNGYLVEAGTAPGASDLLQALVARTSYVSPDLPTQTVYVRVRGVDACDRGFPSNELVITPPD